MAQALPAFMIAQGALSILQTYQQSEALKEQDRFQRTQADQEAQVLDLQAADAVKRGDEAAGRIRQQTTRLRGSQRAAYAGQGVDPNSGSAAAVGVESDLYGKLDIATAKTNAWREAWGLRSQAEAVRADSRMKSLAGKNERKMTLLTGGLQAASSFAEAGYYGSRRGFQPRNSTEARFNNGYRGSR